MTAQTMTTPSTRPGFLGWIWRLLIGLLALIIIFIITGVIYEARAERAVAALYPPPGELVPVNGRQMHINCRGSGSPTVILDAGQGGWSSDWQQVAPAVSENTRVCTYDRAGYGWSEPADDSRTPQHIAADLAALLAAAEIEPPYIVVGFSYSGLSTRLFAAQHSDDVAGMVLVDPALEYHNEMMPAELMGQQKALAGTYRLFGLAARLGIVRLLDPQEMAPYAPFIVENNSAEYYDFLADPDWWVTSRLEFSSNISDAELAYIGANGTFPDRPVILIGAEKNSAADSDMIARYQADHLQKLEEMAEAAPQAAYVLAEGSTHAVLQDRPDVIIEAIGSLLGDGR